MNDTTEFVMKFGVTQDLEFFKNMNFVFFHIFFRILKSGPLRMKNFQKMKFIILKNSKSGVTPNFMTNSVVAFIFLCDLVLTPKSDLKVQ